MREDWKLGLVCDGVQSLVAVVEEAGDLVQVHVYGKMSDCMFGCDLAHLPEDGRGNKLGLKGLTVLVGDVRQMDRWSLILIVGQCRD